MPVLKCLNAGCQWQSQDLDAAFADALTKQPEMHNQEVHAPAAAAAAAAAAQAAVQDFHKIVHSDNLQNWILWRDKLFCDSWLCFTT